MDKIDQALNQKNGTDIVVYTITIRTSEIQINFSLIVFKGLDFLPMNSARNKRKKNSFILDIPRGGMLY